MDQDHSPAPCDPPAPLLQRLVAHRLLNASGDSRGAMNITNVDSGGAAARNRRPETGRDPKPQNRHHNKRLIFAGVAATALIAGAGCTTTPSGGGGPATGFCPNRIDDSCG